MRAVIQRVSSAELYLEGEAKVYSSIGAGLVALVAVAKGDTEENADRLLESIINYRVFPDAAGRMNLSLLECKKDLMLVSQFTLAADTRKGRKPSFSPAAEPDAAKRLFDYLLAQAVALSRQHDFALAAGSFGAMMNIHLVNQGPVTFILDR